MREISNNESNRLRNYYKNCCNAAASSFKILVMKTYHTLQKSHMSQKHYKNRKSETTKTGFLVTEFTAWNCTICNGCGMQWWEKQLFLQLRWNKESEQSTYFNITTAFRNYHILIVSSPVHLRCYSLLLHLQGYPTEGFCFLQENITIYRAPTWYCLLKSTPDVSQRKRSGNKRLLQVLSAYTGFQHNQ